MTVSGRPSRGTALTILFVDDDADCRLIYATYLRTNGWVVFTADDGRGAIDKAMDLRPDAVVLDLSMPRVDGWTVLRELRGSSWTADIPIVVLTATSSTREAAFEAGCNAYLAKPCPPQTLLLQLRGLFRSAATEVRYGVSQ